MATGNGAYIVHRMLEKRLKGYQVKGYHPNWTLMPFFLPLVASSRYADLVHTTPDYAFFFRRRSVPLVVSFQNYVLDDGMRPFSSVLQNLHYRTNLRFFTKKALKVAQVVTAVSRFTADCVRKDLQFNRPIDIIYNGVDTSFFHPNSSKENESREVRVFYSGNLTQRKGAQWLVPIADKLDKRVRIYYTQGLRTRNALPRHNRLRPIGPVSFEDMPSRYHQMDILLMPTVREGLSLAVMEAMACGLPVVASDCSSLPEQIDPGKGGFLCPVGDVKAFAEHINRLARSARLRKKLGQYNRSKAQRLFAVEDMLDGYKKLFEKLLTSARG